MKITNEQLRALQDNDIRRTKSQKTSGEFSELFARQLDTEQSAAATGADGIQAQPQAASALSFGAPVETADTGRPLRVATQLMDGMCDTVDQYADSLTRRDSGLKEAYGLLQSLSSQIDDFKTRFPDAGESMPELAGILNELDVLAAAETYKLNRGDYA